ncbi:MAG TPA: hypothetical protein PLB34_10580, partial [Rhodoblastus sp.]|nr:hypothetical protein [Rhodoblastus sp.]
MPSPAAKTTAMQRRADDISISRRGAQTADAVAKSFEQYKHEAHERGRIAVAADPQAAPVKPRSRNGHVCVIRKVSLSMIVRRDVLKGVA